MKYNWITIGDESKPAIALLALANGPKIISQKTLEELKYQPEKLEEALAQNAKIAFGIKQRSDELLALGFCVKIPQYEDGSQIFEPDAEIGSAEIGASASRVVSKETGSAQIIDCAENGWDIYAWMGGWSMSDKIGKAIKHFDSPDAKTPEKPIRIFGYSDITFAAFLQSHHPDIFRFYSCPSIYCSLVVGKKGESCNEEKRAGRDVAALLTRDEIPALDRKILFKSAQHQSAEFTMQKVQYLPLHNDMIWADAAKYKVPGSDAAPEYAMPKLQTSRPYILGCEGFIQKPMENKQFNSKFPQFFRIFLEERRAKNELPQAVEIGLITTRMDGKNGYVGILHDEETGLIALSDFNIARILQEKEGLKKQLIDVIKTTPEKAAKTAETITDIPPQIREKYEREGDKMEINADDVTLILENENKKILQMRDTLLETCREFNITAFSNYRCGHTLNMGVIGGGVVDMKIKEKKVELTHVPTLEKVTENPHSLSKRTVDKSPQTLVTREVGATKTT